MEEKPAGQAKQPPPPHPLAQGLDTPLVRSVSLGIVINVGSLSVSIVT